MDISKVQDVLSAMINILLSVLKGLGVIDTDEEKIKSEAYTTDFSNLFDALADAFKK